MAAVRDRALRTPDSPDERLTSSPVMRVSTATPPRTAHLWKTRCIDKQDASRARPHVPLSSDLRVRSCADCRADHPTRCTTIRAPTNVSKVEASRVQLRTTLSDAVFERLVDTHRLRLERFVRSLGASREDAEEIASTALLRAYQHPPSARGDDEWRAWLSVVARNLWIDTCRRRQLRLVTGEGSVDGVPSPSAPVDQIAAAAQEARQICAAIAMLPPTQRAAIYLREMRGLSYEEIGSELGITLKAVTTALERARDKVKQQGKISRALSALSLSPLAWVRRGAATARHVSMASGTAVAKVAVPTLVIASVGGAGVLAVQHPQHRGLPDIAAPHAATALSSELPATLARTAASHHTTVRRSAPARPPSRRSAPPVSRHPATATHTPAATTAAPSSSASEISQEATQGTPGVPSQGDNGKEAPVERAQPTASAERHGVAADHANAKSAGQTPHSAQRPVTPQAKHALPASATAAPSSAHAVPHQVAAPPSPPTKGASPANPASPGGDGEQAPGGTGAAASDGSPHASGSVPADTHTTPDVQGASGSAPGPPATPAQPAGQNPGHGQGAP